MWWGRLYRIGPLSWGYAVSAVLWSAPVITYQVTLTLGRRLAVSLVVSREL